MSLIDEALKRARQEAARQEAAEREARYARVPVYMPPPRRSRPWLLPAVVSICLAAGVGAGVVISHKSPHPLAPSPVRPPAPAPNGRGGTPATPTTIADTPVVERAEEPVVEEESPEPPAARQAAPAPTPAPVQESAVEPPPSPPPPSPPPAPPSPAIALPQPPAAEPLSYVREVPAPGGGTVRLNGIAFSEQPVALFGDKVVAPGESVSGFTVVAIEAQRVKLQGAGGAVVYVTLK